MRSTRIALVAVIAGVGFLAFFLPPAPPVMPISERSFTVNGLALGTDSETVRSRYGPFERVVPSQVGDDKWRRNSIAEDGTRYLGLYGPFEKLIIDPEHGVDEVTGSRLEEKGVVLLVSGDRRDRIEAVLGETDMGCAKGQLARYLVYQTANGCRLEIRVDSDPTIRSFTLRK